MNVCALGECNKQPYAFGMCSMHYQAERRKKLSYPYRRENRMESSGDVTEVILENAKRVEVARAVIDTVDIEKIRPYKWHLNSHGYARHKSYRHGGIFMHNLIFGSKRIDHADRNRLNNRRHNLRAATYSQNATNTKRTGNNKYRGVETTKSGSYKISLRTNGVTIRVGNFSDIVEAAYIYDQIAMQICGEFAITNFEY